MVEWGSMYDWWTMAERQLPSITASASANPFSTSPRLNVICDAMLLGLPSVSSCSTPAAMCPFSSLRSTSLMGERVRGGRRLRGRDHRGDAGVAARPAGVDRLDAGVGVGAAQNLGVEHPRQLHVVRVDGLARDLAGGAARAHGLADRPVLFLGRGLLGHEALPLAGPLGGGEHRLVYLGVAGAAAEGTRQTPPA